MPGCVFCVLEMELTRLSPRGVRLDTDSPFLGGLGKPLGAPLHLGPSDQGLGQAGVGQVRPLHDGAWELGGGEVGRLHQSPAALSLHGSRQGSFRSRSRVPWPAWGASCPSPTLRARRACLH